MPDANKTEKRIVKSNRAPSKGPGKIAAFMVRTGKRLKNFFVNMRAEVKRIVWPDRKRLIQNTATVLAICLLAGLLLFIIDFALGNVLEGIGFYNPGTPTAATTAATTATTSSGETTVTTSGETTSTTAGTTTETAAS